MRLGLGVAAVFLGTVMLAAAPRAQQSRVPAAGAAGRPVFVPADRMDVSRALRRIPALPPQAGAHLHETPLFRRLVGPRSTDPVVQSSPIAPLITSPTFSIEGVDNVNGVLPPDTNGAVGPNDYVQWVNLSFAVYSKGSATTPPALLYGPAAGNTLWTGFGGPCETTNNGDPVVRYDHLADRWVMSQLALPNDFLGVLIAPFYQCIAVSATADPLGPYYRYQFSFNKLNDYPKFGVWPDAYYMTMNQYSAPSLTFAGQGVVAFDRASMLLGLPASMIYFDLSSVDMNLGGMLPADLDGPAPPAGSPDFYAQIDDDAWGYAPVDQIQIWRFHVDWTNPSASTFTHAASVPTAPFDSNMCGYAQSCIPQPGTSVGLDALADRLMYRLQYRNFGDHESLVVNHTVDVDGTDHAGVRWYEIRDPNGSPFIYQQGSYAPDSDNRWMASAAMDSAGDLAIGFSVSSATTYPSIRYAGRLATDPLGTLAQGETELMTGSGVETDSSSRWGDYSMMTVDPVDDCTFWYTQEYYAATTDPAGWRTRIGSFSFPACTPATQNSGPAVTIAATTATAYEAGLLPGVFTVTRTGDTSQPVTVPYTVGGTATAGTQYVALSGSVAIPAGAASATISVVPMNDPFYYPNESVIVTLTAPGGYVVGSPGSAAVTIVSNTVPPDLVVAALTGPSVGGANGTISVNDTTKNQGTGPSNVSTTGFYLSKDPTLSSDDVLLGTRQVAALAAGALDSATTTLTIPANTSTGSYYVIAKADSPNAIIETNEPNNTKWMTIAIGPDLAVSAVAVPATAAPGGTMVVSDTTINRGGDAAPASATGFYLSTNGLFDASDVFLGSRSVPALAAGASSSGTATVTLPPNTPVGAYFVFAVADYANTVVESNEINNNRLATSQVRIGPDLTVSALSAPTIGGAGATLSVTDTTSNIGAADAGSSVTAFYLSTNLSLDSSDVLIGSRAVPALGAGTSSSASTALSIPANTPTGTYYIIANADDSKQISESNETNNTKFSFGIRIGPDLVEASTTTPGIGGAGLPIVIGDTTKNQGGGNAGASNTALYVSTSSIFNSSATLLGTHPVPAIAAGASSAASTTVTLPSTLATGTYYVIAVADTSNAVPETSETNNAGFGVQVRVGPDLTVTAASAPSSIVAGSTVTLNSTVLNQGGGTAAASTTRFYLSTNFTLDSSDVLLGTRSVGALAPGQSDSGPASITIPPGTPAAGYYLLVVSDGDNVVPETNENNNVRYVVVLVSASAQQ